MRKVPYKCEQVRDSKGLVSACISDLRRVCHEAVLRDPVFILGVCLDAALGVTLKMSTIVHED